MTKSTKTKKQPIHLRDIILIALIGIIFGVIYFSTDFLYNAITVALTPLKWGPAADDIVIGIWCMAGPIAGFLVPHIGSAFLGEFLGAAGEAVLGGEWGASTLITGFLQGIAAELGFTFTGYKKYNWGTTMVTVITMTVVTYAWHWIKHGYGHFTIQMQIALFLISFVSMFLFSGVLVQLIIKILKRTHLFNEA